MTETRVFGHISDVAVGSCYAGFKGLNASGLHKPTQAGISGSEKDGADSIVVSGGYEDDLDLGYEIVYTGHGGRDNSGKHIADQELKRGNLALVVNEMEGLPVRVIWGADPRNAFAPASGYRYDGLYRVDSHWHETGKAGFRVWRYRLLKLEEEASLPAIPNVPENKPLGAGNVTPVRKAMTVQRVVRDTKQAKALKRHYEHTCQVCGTCITKATGPYAEAAHIRPLGQPHNGPDTYDKIICLCPNHHVMFDLGVIAVADNLTLIGITGTLAVREGHRIDFGHLAYHREHYLNRSD